MSGQINTVLRRIFEELFNEHKLELIPELYADNCMSCDPANDRDMQGMDDLLMLLEGSRTTNTRRTRSFRTAILAVCDGVSTSTPHHLTGS